MLTRVTIDNDDLLRQAQRLSGLKTRRRTVEAALNEFVQVRIRRQRGILKLIGTVDFREDWDPIRERHRDDPHQSLAPRRRKATHAH